MSAAASEPSKGFAVRAVNALLLAALVALLFAVDRRVPGAGSGMWMAAGFGFLLIGGTLLSEATAPLGLPHLTGYLIAGVAAGPHGLGVVDEATVHALAPVNTLALALIALAGGTELDLAAVKKGARGLIWGMGVQTPLVLVAATGAFAAARPLIPFARGLPFAAFAGLAVCWGALAVTRSPSATLALLSQTRANGPLATFTLAFVMASDVLVVVLVALVLGCVRPLVDPSAGFSLASFLGLGHDLFGSVALGTTLGLVIAAYLRVVGRQMLVVLLALGFVVSNVLDYLRFDALLTFMVAGFIVRNLSKQGAKLLSNVEQMGAVVYVVFFAIAGAELDVPLLRTLWPVALILAGARAATTWVAARAASRWAGDPPALRRWSWSGLISQAGLTLGLSLVVARELPGAGSAFRSLVIASVAVNEIVGPVVFKFALDRTGETSARVGPSFPSMPPPGVPE